jgi:hypothetical protein
METETTLTDTLSDNEKLSIELFKTFVADAIKFRTKGTASAVARARKSASALAKLLKVVRKELQEAKTALVEAKKAAKVE